MKYFHPIRCDTCDSKKNNTPSTRARIRARKNTFGQYPTIPLIQSNHSSTLPIPPSKKTFTYKETFISNETTIDKSAMKQPTTNHSSNPKPIVIRTTYESISQSKDDKTKYRQRKNGTNMPFFHSLGLFLPIY